VGQYYWGGMAGTFFFIDPKEDLFALFMSQGPGQRDHFRSMTRAAIFGALED
jgi:CubicO group peptidase (beta-lactamase class C family)